VVVVGARVARCSLLQAWVCWWFGPFWGSRWSPGLLGSVGGSSLLASSRRVPPFSSTCHVMSCCVLFACSGCSVGCSLLARCAPSQALVCWCFGTVWAPAGRLGGGWRSLVGWSAFVSFAHTRSSGDVSLTGVLCVVRVRWIAVLAPVVLLGSCTCSFPLVIAP